MIYTYYENINNELQYQKGYETRLNDKEFFDILKIPTNGQNYRKNNLYRKVQKDYFTRKSDKFQKIKQFLKIKL